MMRFSIHTHRYEVLLPPVPSVISATVGNRVFKLTPFHWCWAWREDWPETWREQPIYEGPIFRWWAVGPFAMWHFSKRLYPDGIREPAHN
jgi:hypothetical protein